MMNVGSRVFFAGNVVSAMGIWAWSALFKRPAAGAFFFAWALTFVVFLIAGREFKSMLTTIGCAFAYLVVLEILQKAGWILGTFRAADLLFGGIGCVLSGILILRVLRAGRRTRRGEPDRHEPDRHEPERGTSRQRDAA